MQINRKDLRTESLLLTCSLPLYFQNKMEATNDRGFRDHGRKQFRRCRLPASVQRQHPDHPRARRRTLLAVSQRARVTRERILLSAVIGDSTETTSLSPVSAHDPGGTE